MGGGRCVARPNRSTNPSSWAIGTAPIPGRLGEDQRSCLGGPGAAGDWRTGEWGKAGWRYPDQIASTDSLNRAYAWSTIGSSIRQPGSTARWRATGSTQRVGVSRRSIGIVRVLAPLVQRRTTTRAPTRSRRSRPPRGSGGRSRGGSSPIGQTSWLAAKRPTAGAPLRQAEPLLDQLADHRHEGGVRPRARRAHEVQARARQQYRGPRRRGRTAPRGDPRRSRSARRRRRSTPRSASAREVVEDVRLEPRHVRRSAAALIDERRSRRRRPPRRRAAPTRAADPRSGTPAAIADRDRVRRERDMRLVSPRTAARAPPARGRRSPRSSPGWLKNMRVRTHLGCARPHLLLRVEEVLAVLPAARVRRVGRREERERPLDPVVGHLAQRVGEERIPVPVAEVDRERDPVRVELARAAPRSARGSAR